MSEDPDLHDTRDEWEWRQWRAWQPQWTRGAWWQRGEGWNPGAWSAQHTAGPHRQQIHGVRVTVMCQQTPVAKQTAEPRGAPDGDIIQRGIAGELGSHEERQRFENMRHQIDAGERPPAIGAPAGPMRRGRGEDAPPVNAAGFKAPPVTRMRRGRGEDAPPPPQVKKAPPAGFKAPPAGINAPPAGIKTPPACFKAPPASLRALLPPPPCQLHWPDGPPPPPSAAPSAASDAPQTAVAASDVSTSAPSPSRVAQCRWMYAFR